MRSATTTLRNFLHQNTDAVVVDLVTITLATATVYRWTSHGENITTGGFTWTAGGTGTAPLVGRGRIRDAVGLEPSDLDMVLWCGTSAEMGSGIKLQLAAVNGVLDGARVKLERCYLDSAGAVIGTLNRFEGQVSDVTVNSTSVELKTRSDLESLNQVLPRNLYKSQCLHAVFDAGCGVTRANYTSSTTAAAGSSSVTINHALGSAPGYFIGGSIYFTSGALTGQSRTIVASTTTSITVEFPFSAAPATGNAFSAYPGCDKTAATCNSKYINLPRRRGFDFVPTVDSVSINPTAEYSASQNGVAYVRGNPGSFKGDKTGQASSYGKPIPIVYGYQRIPPMVILAGLYTNGLSGYGAMGGGLVQLALCEGPIAGIASVWQEKTKYTPGALGLTIQTGAGITAWSAATTYAKGDWASSGGTNYASKAGGNLNHVPPNATWWEARGSATDERAQSPWSYLTSTWPALALGYGGTAVASLSSGWGTTVDGALKRATFEVQGLLCGTAWYFGSAGGLAGPPMVLTDLLTNAEYGLGWPTSRIPDYGTGSGVPSGFTTGLGGTTASGYDYLVRANSWGLGLAIESQRPARDIVEEILQATDSTCTWSDGQLKVFPMSTIEVSDGVVTYTPHLTPLYDLGASSDGADFLAEAGEDPISVERSPVKEHFNCFPVEWSNQTPSRTDITGAVISEPSNAFNADTEEGTPDPADVALYGVRKASTTNLRCIVDKTHAASISNALARRSVTSRNTYRFRLPWRLALCEPCDLVTLTDAKMGASRKLVRIVEIEEDEMGSLDVVAEEVGTVATAASASYTLS
ncbi:MAG: DUF2163 domain-containing protein [Betaproteobacteria bacterium]|nr:DUF2163 domain-containing protein [Betaproteobacteria bacterium]